MWVSFSVGCVCLYVHIVIIGYISLYKDRNIIPLLKKSNIIFFLIARAMFDKANENR